MNSEKRWNTVCKRIEQNNYLSTPINNRLLKLYLEAKLNGGYERIVYEKVINFTTCIKKAFNLSKIDDFFKKDFYTLTEKDVLNYRNLLNNDQIYKKKYVMPTKKKKGKTLNTKIPLKYRTKQDLRKNFIEFWKFVTEYYYQTKNKDLPDITKYWKLTKPHDYNEIIVEFLTKDEIKKLLKRIHNEKFKALVQLSIMSGARPCEALNIRYGRSYNLYKNEKGKWTIRLPKVKGVSHQKYPFVIDMFESDLIPYINELNLKDGDIVFDYNEYAFHKYMRYYSLKSLNRSITPKILRKTARMIRSNAGYDHDKINKLMGHAPGSKIQAHYTNYNGIITDEETEKINNYMNQDIVENYSQMKMRMNAMEERNERMEKILLALANEEKLKSLNNEVS